MTCIIYMLYNTCTKLKHISDVVFIRKFISNIDVSGLKESHLDFFKCRVSSGYRSSWDLGVFLFLHVQGCAHNLRTVYVITEGRQVVLRNNHPRLLYSTLFSFKRVNNHIDRTEAHKGARPSFLRTWSPRWQIHSGLPSAAAQIQRH
jgi:hypothetical protein